MNASKNEIHVILENRIVDGDVMDAGQSTDITNDSGTSPAVKKKSDKLGLTKAVVANTVNRAGQFALSNYGNLTGDYITQSNIQGGLEAVGLVGLALSSPAGAVAAASSLALKGINNHIDLIQKNRQTDFLRARTGMMNISGGR